MENRVERTPAEVRQAFCDQVNLLALTCRTFDAGHAIAGKQIATLLRNMFYAPIRKSNKRTAPMLHQLKLNTKHFLNTSNPIDRDRLSILCKSRTEIVPICGLVDVFIGESTGGFFAPLDDRKSGEWPFIPYGDWWTMKVLRDTQGETASRLDLVSLIADTDGGSHVDTHLPVNLAKWKSGMSLGWNYQKDGEDKKRLLDVELHAMRQIAHETLRTLKKTAPWALSVDYPYPQAGIIPEPSATFRQGIVITSGAELRWEPFCMTISSDA